MAYFKKYNCEFMDSDNNSCQISIWQELSSQPPIKEFTCSKGSVILENEEINIKDSFIGSQRFDFEAISKNVFDWHDLYSVDMFFNKVELRINNELRFTGYIDPESYEEPFDKYSNFPVMIKCGNLKCLTRIDFTDSSIGSVKSIVTNIIIRIIPNAVLSFDTDTKCWHQGKKYNIEDLQVNPYVFFSDNDFQYPKSWDVLEEICKAFQLRIIVSGPNVYIKDLITLKSATAQTTTLLSGSTLSFDEVFNKINIKLDLSTKKPIKDYKIDDALLSGISGQRISIYQGATNPSLADTAFYLREKQCISDTYIDGIKIIGSGNTYLGKINSYYEGSNSSFVRNKAIERISDSNRIIAQFDPIPIYISNTENWYLNIKLDAMLSVLTDPFGNANRAINASNWWRNHENDYLFDSTLVYVPLNVYLKDEKGNILYYLDNVNNPADDHWNKGTWKTGVPAKGAYRLAYYAANVQNHTAFSDGSYQAKISGSKCAETNKGWSTNSQYMTWKLAEHKGKPKLISDMISKGSICNLPPINGILHIELLSGVDCICYNDHVTNSNGKIIQKYEDISWLCYKDLGVSITDSNGKEYYSDDQLEYEVNLNENAENDLSYETKIGCVIDGDKSAKAGIMINGDFVTNFTYSSDATGANSWYLEEHMMRILEPILIKKRYCLSVTSKPITIQKSVKIRINNADVLLYPCLIKYNVDQAISELKLTEL